MTISAAISQVINATNIGEVGSRKITSGTGFPNLTLSYDDGTGSGEASKDWAGKLVISASSNQELDLSGVLVGVEGETVSFTKVKEVIAAIVDPDDTKSCLVGNAASNSFQGGLSAGATMTFKRFFRMPPAPDANGYAVVNSSSDKLRFANPGGSSITVHVWILGV